MLAKDAMPPQVIIDSLTLKHLERHNKEDWKRESFVSEFVQELDTERYFRWFDSGDMYDLRLANKILEIMQATPWVNHWLPTRMHKFDKFAEVIAQMEALPNVVVRKSSDSVTQAESLMALNYVHHSTQMLQVLQKALQCARLTLEAVKCGTCRLCWSKDVSIVAYPAHGAKLLKSS
jgi:hypothetical protein